MFAVYRTADGVLVSIGSTVADPLPAGLTALDLGSDTSLLDGSGRWDVATRSVVQVSPSPAVLVANAEKLRTDTGADLVRLTEAIDALAVLLADETTPGSIRVIVGPTGATAGTGSLRALRQQSNTAVVNAASIKALIGLLIDLAQRDIDTAQAARRVARQALRLSKDMVGDYASADVGAP